MRLVLVLLVTAQAEGPANCSALLQLSHEARWAIALPKVHCRHNTYTHKLGKVHLNKSSNGSYETAALQCPLCGDGKGALFWADRLDGLGESAGFTLFFLATAMAHSLGVGGFLHHQKDKGHDFEVSMGTILGMHYRDLLANRSSFAFHECVHGCDVSGIDRIVPRSGQAVFWGCQRGTEDLPWHQVITGDFLARLQTSSKILSLPTAHFLEGPHIVLHVRRGDVSLENDRIRDSVFQRRYRTDDVYLEVAKTVQSVLPHAQIHVFSTTGYWNSTSFDRYRSRGYNVHLDGREVDDLAHMAKADVLIAAPSSFSFVAALLNPKCVVKFAAFGNELPHFIAHDDGQFSSESLKKLQHCVAGKVKP